MNRRPIICFDCQYYCKVTLTLVCLLNEMWFLSSLNPWFTSKEWQKQRFNKNKFIIAKSIRRFVRNQIGVVFVRNVFIDRMSNSDKSALINWHTRPRQTDKQNADVSAKHSITSSDLKTKHRTHSMLSDVKCMWYLLSLLNKRLCEGFFFRANMSTLHLR